MPTKAGEIADFSVTRCSLPLKTPYKLSFGDLHKYDVVFFHLVLEDGRTGLGEVTALPGYGNETADRIELLLNDCGAKLHGLETRQACNLIPMLFPKHSFAPSAVFTALELATDSFSFPQKIEAPVLFAISVEDPELMLKKTLSIYKRGIKTIKVKTGSDVHADILGIRYLLHHLPEEVVLRLDVNQGYSFPQASKFCEAIAKESSQRLTKIELVEQPLPIESWDEFKQLCDLSPVPMMLDESIYSFEDISRASDCGAEFVKLKLCKHFGCNHVLALAHYAKSMGLKVVLGNGVSSDWTSLVESAIYALEPDLFYGASESVAYSRLTKGVLERSPTENSGTVSFLPPYQCSRH